MLDRDKILERMAREGTIGEPSEAFYRQACTYEMPPGQKDVNFCPSMAVTLD